MPNPPLADPAAPPAPSITPGIKTTEGWLSILMAVASMGGQFAGMIPPPWGIVASAVLTGIYTICRTFVKTQA